MSVGPIKNNFLVCGLVFVDVLLKVGRVDAFGEKDWCFNTIESEFYGSVCTGGDTSLTTINWCVVHEVLIVTYRKNSASTRRNLIQVRQFFGGVGKTDKLFF